MPTSAHAARAPQPHTDVARIERSFFDEFLLQIEKTHALAKRPDGSPIECFISYAWEPAGPEREAMHQWLTGLQFDLERAGIKVWLDINKLHGDLPKYMADGIEQSDFIVLIGTPTLKARLKTRNNAAFEFEQIEKKLAKQPHALLPILYPAPGTGFEASFPDLPLAEFQAGGGQSFAQRYLIFDAQQAAERSGRGYAALMTRLSSPSGLSTLAQPLGLLPVLLGVDKQSQKATIYQGLLAGYQQQFAAYQATTLAVVSLDSEIEQKLRARYKAKEEIAGLFGPPLQLEGQYINVQLIYQSQKTEEKKENAETAEEEDNDKKTDKDLAFHDARMSSFEDLFGQKQALALDKLFVPAKDLLKAGQKTHEQDATQSPRFLLIQGRAGIGKTTMVEFISREWAKGQLWNEQFTWVFTLRLRDLRDPDAVKAFKQQGENAWSVREWVYRQCFVGADIEAADFNGFWKDSIAPLLTTGKVLFILDGFDEIPDEHPCQGAISALLQPEVAKLVTSRPYGTSELPKNRRDLEVVGFVDDNVAQYIRYYYAERPDKAELLLTTLKAHPALWGNAHIPVTLNILCGVVEKKDGADLDKALSELASMSGLYQAMEWGLLERAYLAVPDKALARQHKKALEGKGVESKEAVLKAAYQPLRELLAQVAFSTFKAQQLIITPTQLTDAVKATGVTEEALISERIDEVLALGLLKPVIGDRGRERGEAVGYEFLHLTFQEYYAGRYLYWQATQGNNLATLANALTDIKLNPRYQVVLWFTAGSLNDNTQFSQFMGALTDSRGSDMLGHVQLGLLVRCTEENWDLAVETGWTKRIAHALQHRVHGLWRRYQRGEIANDSTPPVWVGLMKVSSQGYEAQAAKGLDLLRDVTAGSGDSYQKSAQLADFIGWLGLPTPRALSRLVTLLADKDGRVCEKAAKVVGRLGEAAATPEILAKLATLIADKDWEVRWSAAKAVSHLGAAAATPAFLAKLATLLTDEDWEVRKRAADAVGRLGAAEATPAFLAKLATLLTDKDEGVRRRAAYAVGRLGPAAATPEILAILATWLTDEDSNVRWSAAEVVSHLGAAAATPEILAKLATLLTDEDWEVRERAAYAVGKLGAAGAAPAILSQLTTLLADKDGQVRQSAAYAVGGLGTAATTPEILAKLATLLTDEDWEVRSSVAYPVGQLGAAAVTPEILAILATWLIDEDSNVRERAADVVGRLGAAAATPEILAKLATLLTDEDWEVRKSAAEAVGRLGAAAATPEILAKLATLIADKYREVRKSAADAMGQLGAAAVTPEILAILATWLIDEDSNVRKRAADVVGRLGAAGDTPAILATLLTDKDYYVRWRAAYAVGKLGAAGAAPAILSQLTTLLADKDGQVRQSAAYAVGRLGAAAATPEILAKLATWLTDKNRQVHERAATLLQNLSGDCLLSLSKSAWPQQPSLPLLAALTIGNYLSGHSSARVIWQPDDEHNDKGYYCWQGFIDKESFDIRLTLDEARWLRHKTPGILNSVDEGTSAKLLTAIEKEGMMTLPKPENDRMLLEYHEQQGAASSKLVLKAHKNTKSECKAYGLSADVALIPPSDKSACVVS